MSFGIFLMKAATVRIANSPLLCFLMEKSLWQRRWLFEVEPSMTAMKSGVTTMPSSLLFAGFFGTRACSRIFMG